MKNFRIIKRLLVILLVVQFTACNIEPVEGTFIQDICFNRADTGKIRAKVGETDFNAEISMNPEDNYGRTGGFLVVHANGFTHLYIGGFSEGFGVISMDIINPEIGVFDLATTNDGGFVSNENNHELLESFGYIDPRLENTDNQDPYISYANNGGSGTVEITELDLVNQTASGNFSFIGTRLMKDPVSGEVILDGNGEPIIETVEVSCGAFNTIPYEIVLVETTNGPGMAFSDFYAEVDGDEFEETSVVTDKTIVDDELMLIIRAINEQNQLLRIDIPYDLGVGTFAMESISNGTKLIASYNGNNNAENLTSNPGTITITDFDRTDGVIEGSFSFTGTDPLGIDPTVVEVREGEFKLSIPIDGGDPDSVMALVDNEAFGDGTNFIDVVVSDFLGVDIVTVSAVDDVNRSVGLIFPKDIEVGSYAMSSNVVTGNEKIGLYSPDDGNVTSFRSNPGTLTILSYDLASGEIEGTYEFQAVDIFGLDPTVYSVTSGSFFVRIP
jgi:hypothetical protein